MFCLAQSPCKTSTIEHLLSRNLFFTFQKRFSRHLFRVLCHSCSLHGFFMRCCFALGLILAPVSCQCPCFSAPSFQFVRSCSANSVRGGASSGFALVAFGTHLVAIWLSLGRLLKYLEYYWFPLAFSPNESYAPWRDRSFDAPKIYT